MIIIRFRIITFYITLDSLIIYIRKTTLDGRMPDNSLQGAKVFESQKKNYFFDWQKIMFEGRKGGFN